jgi:hypothetical protein
MLWAAVTTLATVASASAGAAEEAPGSAREDERWVPGLSAFSGLLIQGSEASIASAERGFFEDSALSVFAFVGLSAELATPALSAVPGRPSLFVHYDASMSFDSDKAIVNDGAPGEIKVPTNTPTPPVAAVEGQGSATKAKTEPLVLSAGAGVAFKLRAWDRNLRIKPSFEWLWQETTVMGIATDAESLAPPPSEQCPCRTALASASETQGFHSIGPGLEFELDAVRAGPFVMTVYTSGQAYYILGDRTIEFVGSATYSDGSRDLEFRSTYERNPWHYRAGVGLRFRWLPE